MSTLRAVTACSALLALAATGVAQAKHNRDPVDSIVLNTAENPVQSTLVGAPPVTLAGTPKVELAGTPSFSLIGTPTVWLAGTPTVALADDTSVSIAGTPTVALAENSTVNLGGQPAVSIAGTPTVQLAGTPEVRVVNMPDGGGAPPAPPVPQPWQKRFFVEDDTAGGASACTELVRPEGTVLQVDSVFVQLFRSSANGIAEAFMGMSVGPANPMIVGFDMSDAPSGNNQYASLSPAGFLIGPVSGLTTTLELCVRSVGTGSARATYVVTGTTTPVG